MQENNAKKFLVNTKRFIALLRPCEEKNNCYDIFIFLNLFAFNLRHFL